MRLVAISGPLRETLAWCALGSAALAPFLFGAVERRVWMPLGLVWLALGLVASRLSTPQADSGNAPGDAGARVARALLPLHALFAVQLVPLPASALRVLSAGAHAAHFLPDPGDGRFRPLSVSPGATIEAWFYVAALQGLFIAVQGLPPERRRAALLLLVVSASALAAEGLWQSRAEHPFYLYGRIPTNSPQGLEASTYGPYFNRNHFATVTAVAAGICAGLAAAAGRAAGGLRLVLTSREGLPRVIVLSGLSAFLSLVSAASGSRSGAIAALLALGAVTLTAFGARAFAVAVAVAGGLALLAGPASVERLAHLDLAASRWLPWLDMTTLFRFFWTFGAGIGAFGAAYWPYQRNAAYEFWQHAHNDYLEWLIETGALGIPVLVTVLRSLGHNLRVAEGAREVLTGAATAVLVQSFLDFPMRIPANGGFFVCVLALALCGPRDGDRSA